MLELLVIIGGVGLLEIAVILLTRPVDFGLPLLAIGICVQAIVLALVIVPTLGTQGAYAALWKEAAVGILIFALTLAKNRFVARRLPVSVLVVICFTCAQLSAYAAFPSLFTPVGVPTLAMTARLAGLREWLVPLELILLGHALHNAGLSIDRLLAFVKRFGAALATIAVVCWVIVPLGFWERVNVSTIAVLSEDPSVATGHIEGLQTYYLGQVVPRAVAPFGSPLALSFSLVLPICLVWAERRRGEVRPLAVLLAFALVLTQTRGVLLGIIIAWVLYKLRPRNVDRRLVIGIFVLTALALGPLRGAITNTVTLKDPSMALHVRAIRDGSTLLLSNPLGLGLGQGGQIGRVFARSSVGESLFLVAGNERGWLGLLLILALFAFSWHALRPHAALSLSPRNARHSEILRRGVRAALLVLFAASVTTEHAIAFTSSWLLWIAVGYGVTYFGLPAFVEVSKATQLAPEPPPTQGRVPGLSF